MVAVRSSPTVGCDAVRGAERRTGLAPARRAVIGVVIGAALSAAPAPRWTPETPCPPLAPRTAFAALFDTTPVTLTLSFEWQKQHVVVPAWRVTSDWTVWRDMRFDDWNLVPSPLRNHALTRMLQRYSHVLADTTVWSRMDAADWDAVPSPIRAMAIMRMVDAWVARYRPASACPISAREISNTISAIIMTESWFEHRAVNVGRSGNRDLGLAQASDSCRAKIAQLATTGGADFTMTEKEYFNPWKATRVATFWLVRLLGQADGDLDLAVRAYHRGIVAARRGEGKEYLASVTWKRRVWIDNQDAPPAWSFVFSRARFDGSSGLADGDLSWTSSRAGAY